MPPRIFTALRHRAKNGLTLEKLVLKANVVSERDIAALKRLDIAHSVEVKHPWVVEADVDPDALSEYADEEYDELQESSYTGW